MLDISTAFPNSSETILSCLKSAGKGFYIPLYQRQYSWKEDNIDQLMESICWGIKELLDDDNAIRFMGTIILFQEQDRDNNIKPQDRRALPTRIDNVIDGQQRISTIAVLATQLYFRLREQQKYFSEKSEGYYQELSIDIEARLKDLLDLFSVDLQRGTPDRKPLIIRGSIDQWTLNGEDEENYKSDISILLAKSIRAISKKENLMPSTKRKTQKSLVDLNVDLINKWLDRVEETLGYDEVLPNADLIISKIKQEYIWSYDRDELKEIILRNQTVPNEEYLHLNITVKLLAFIHYLCKRSCFTLIEPRSENWAFDMFQSLNATGTPLTAIETFKPLVVNDFDHIDDNTRFKGSNVEKYFNNIEAYMNSKDIKQKDKTTSEYLIAFSLCYDGNKSGMTTQFSSQRAWLNKIYSAHNENIAQKEEIIKKMSDLSLFLSDVIHFDPNETPYINKLVNLSRSEKNIIALNCLYLKDSNHKMSYTVLAIFYSRVLRCIPNSEKDFFEISCIIATFYSLWRSCDTNSGIDEVYRKLLKGTDGKNGICWLEGDKTLDISHIKNHFKKALEEKFTDFDGWFKKAKDNLRYKKANSICRFVLLYSFHDTIPDVQNKGLVKQSVPGVCTYLTPHNWISKKLKTIEHIAPQNNATGWDEEIYPDADYQQIGNLTLLPTEINSSLSNRGWQEKLIYYKHLSEEDPDKLEFLKGAATNIGLILDSKKIEMMKAVEYNNHILPITILNDGFIWDKTMIENRTKNICEIFWDRNARFLDFNKPK